jgi:hypothetical protein
MTDKKTTATPSKAAPGGPADPNPLTNNSGTVGGGGGSVSDTTGLTPLENAAAGAKGETGHDKDGAAAPAKK